MVRSDGWAAKLGNIFTWDFDVEKVAKALVEEERFCCRWKYSGIPLRDSMDLKIYEQWFQLETPVIKPLIGAWKLKQNNRRWGENPSYKLTLFKGGQGAKQLWNMQDCIPFLISLNYIWLPEDILKIIAGFVVEEPKEAKHLFITIHKNEDGKVLRMFSEKPSKLGLEGCGREVEFFSANCCIERYNVANSQVHASQMFFGRS